MRYMEKTTESAYSWAEHSVYQVNGQMDFSKENSRELSNI